MAKVVSRPDADNWHCQNIEVNWNHWLVTGVCSVMQSRSTVTSVQSRYCFLDLFSCMSFGSKLLCFEFAWQHWFHQFLMIHHWLQLRPFVSFVSAVQHQYYLGFTDPRGEILRPQRCTHVSIDCIWSFAFRPASVMTRRKRPLGKSALESRPKLFGGSIEEYVQVW